MYLLSLRLNIADKTLHKMFVKVDVMKSYIVYRLS